MVDYQTFRQNVKDLQLNSFLVNQFLIHKPQAKLGTLQQDLQNQKYVLCLTINAQ